MKKTLLIGLVAFIGYVIPIKAQLQKGTKYVAATITLDGNNQHYDDYSSNNSGKGSNLSVSPSFQFGKFVKENKMIGIGAGTNLWFFKQKYNSQFQTDNYKSNYVAYSLSPYIRQYKPLNTKWALFLNSSVTLSYLHSKSGINEELIKHDGYSGGIKVTPGISYWITPRFALESDINLLSLGLSYQDFQDVKTITFRSVATSNLTSYFSVRASWYLQKP